MQFTITDPEKNILETEARLVQLPGEDGLFEVLDRHAPIISILKKGVIRIVDPEGRESRIEIDGGFFAMAHNTATVIIL